MDEDFCVSLPKLELHAHLNGSLSEKTLKKLHTSQASIEDFLKLNQVLDLGPSRTLEECFSLFKIAHTATNNPESVCLATQDVISEFSEDGVIYLELRTTPRREPEMSKSQYVDAVIEGIKTSQKKISKIRVKLILSLDRKQPLNEATENVNLVIKYREKHPDIVVGVDVSGDPTKGTWFEPLVERIRRETDLKITLHCAEVPNINEVGEILKFRPERIGHGTCIVPETGGSELIWQTLIQQGIPVECCLTSNVKTKTVDHYAIHHVQHFINAGHPFTFCTDDKGVFSTTLSHEYKLAADTFNLSKNDLWEISYKTIDYTFCVEDERNQLRKLMKTWFEENLQKTPS